MYRTWDGQSYSLILFQGAEQEERCAGVSQRILRGDLLPSLPYMEDPVQNYCWHWVCYKRWGVNGFLKSATVDTFDFPGSPFVDAYSWIYRQVFLMWITRNLCKCDDHDNDYSYPNHPTPLSCCCYCSPHCKLGRSRCYSLLFIYNWSYISDESSNLSCVSVRVSVWIHISVDSQ